MGQTWLLNTHPAGQTRTWSSVSSRTKSRLPRPTRLGVGGRDPEIDGGVARGAGVVGDGDGERRDRRHRRRRRAELLGLGKGGFHGVEVAVDSRCGGAHDPAGGLDLLRVTRAQRFVVGTSSKAPGLVGATQSSERETTSQTDAGAVGVQGERFG